MNNYCVYSIINLGHGMHADFTHQRVLLIVLCNIASLSMHDIA